jgi:autotransporter-associated beta strand protein
MKTAKRLAAAILCAGISTGLSEDGTTSQIAIKGMAAPGFSGVNLSAFSGTPVLNKNGTVAFLGVTADGNQAIYTSTNGVLTAVATTLQLFPGATDDYSGFTAPVLADNGTVAFSGQEPLGKQGIFTSTGGVLTVVTSSTQTVTGLSGIFSGYPFSPVIAENGKVVFRVDYTGANGLFIGSGGALSTVATTLQTMPVTGGTYSNLGAPVMNNLGVTAFSGLSSNNGYGLFTSSGSSVVTIATTSQAAPELGGNFTTLTLNPALNDSGTVAFQGANGTAQGIYTGNGGALTTIASTARSAPGLTGNFTSFAASSVSLNNQGSVAFVGSASGGQQGVFKSTAGVLSPIVTTAQAVPGNSSGTFRFFDSPAINNSGTVAVLATLTGSPSPKGIYLGDGQELITAAATGQAVAGSTITALSFAGGADKGGTSGFNDNGQVAYKATLANGLSTILLYTPTLHYRSTIDGNWATNTNWTVSLQPGSVHDVFINPSQNLTVTGPSTPTSVKSLTIGGTGVADLSLQPSGPLSAAGGFNLTSLGRLSGNGAINGNVTAGGTLSPGGMLSSGSITIAGNVTLQSTSHLAIQLGGLAPASYDFLNVTGALSLGGSLDVSLLGGFTPQLGNSFNLFDAPAQTGAFSSINLPTLSAGLAWDTTQVSTLGQVTVIPGGPVGNNSVLGVSGTSLDLGRMFVGNVTSQPITVSRIGGTSPTGFSVTYTGNATATGMVNCAPGAITGAASGSFSASLVGAIGNNSGTILVQNTGDDGSGPTGAAPGQGTAQAASAITITGNVVGNRVISSTTVDLGRVMVNAPAGATNNLVLTSTGSDDANTRITVSNGGVDSLGAGFSVSGGSPASAFNGTWTGDVRSLSGGTFSSAGVQSGTVTLTNAGAEGNGTGILAGQTPGTTLVHYAATALQQRTVTAAPINMGRFIAGQPVGGTSLLSTSGDDSSRTRVAVNGTLFNSASVTSTFNLAPVSYPLGSVSGVVNLPVTGEGLSGEGSYAPVAVSYLGSALQPRVVTATPIDLGRFMASQGAGGTSTLLTSGDDSIHTRVTVNDTLFDASSATSTYMLIPATYLPGAVSGSVNLPVTGEGIVGEGAYSPVSVGFSGAALQQRTVTATPISLGRFIAGQSVGGTSLLSTSGDDSSRTRVAVNGTLFNSASTTGTFNLAPASYPIGSVSGVVNLPVTGEGLSGEGSYAPVAVSYLGSALQPRLVTASPIDLGRFMASQGAGGASTLVTSGIDSTNTRVTVNGTLFDDASVTGTYTLAPVTYLPGSVSGSINLPVTGEGLAGEGAYSPVAVGFSGAALQQRTVTAAPINLGRFIAGQPVGGTSLLSTSGDDSSRTRVAVNGTLFNSASVTGIFNLATASYPIGSVSGVVNLPVTGEGLSGEGSYAPVAVSYLGSALQPRLVTATPVALSGMYHAGANLGAINTSTTLNSAGADAAFTRVTVAGHTFSSTTSVASVAVSGIVTNAASSGTLGSLTVTGEGLAGEGTYANVDVGYTAVVTSGKSTWTSGASHSWADNSNWTDNLGVHAAPGTFAGFDNVDTATISNATNPTTITLDDAAPSLKVLSISGALPITVASGTGNNQLTLKSDIGSASIVVGGNQTISAPMNLASDTIVTVAGSTDQLNLTGDINGSASLTKTGSGTLYLSGAQNYATLNANAGTTIVDSARGTSVLNTNGGVTSINSTLGNGTAVINANATTNLSGNQTLSALTIGAGAVVTFGSDVPTQPTAYILDTNGQNVTWANNLTSAAASLTKSGAGTLTLAGSNTYGGSTTINGGVLSINASNNLGDASKATNTISINGGTLQDTGSGVILGVNRSIAIGAGAANIDVTAGKDLTIAGVISGPGNALTKSGSGKVTVTGTNTYGATVITGGTMEIGNGGTGGSLGSGPVTNNGVLIFDRSNAYAASNDITGSGAVTNAGSGELTLSGTQNYAALNANAGVTNLNSALGTGNSTINAAATVNINASQNLAALNIGAGSVVTFGADSGASPFTAALATTATVPEPGTLGLLIIGALGISLRRRRK